MSRSFRLTPLVLSVLCLAMAPALSIAAPATGPAPKPSAAQTRNCLLGLGYVTSERSLKPDVAYNLIAQAADIAYIQRNWEEWLNKPDVCAREIALARSKKLKIYLAFDALSYDDLRAQILLPKGLKGDFSTPAVRTAYLQLMAKIARDFKPDYFVPMVEIDLHKRKSPKSYAAYKELYPSAYEAIKTASPSSMVAPSITYGDYDSKNGIDEGDKREFANVIKDFSTRADMLAVSTYPLSFLTPKTIPREFFFDMCAAADLPLFISETSWPSATFEIPMGAINYKFKTSESDQAAYVEKLHEAADFLKLKGRKIIAVNLISLADPGSLTTFLANLVHHQFNWFCSLALADNGGKLKLSFEKLKSWRAMPLARD